MSRGRSKPSSRFLQGVLGFIEFGYGAQVIQTRAGEVLLGLNCFEDNTDGEFFALLGKVQGLFGGGEGAASSSKLIVERLPMGEGFDDLASKFVTDFVLRHFGLPDARLGSTGAGNVKEATGADAPTQAK